jgi:hypothetical protein
MSNAGVITAAIIIALGLVAASIVDNYGYVAAQAMVCEEGEIASMFEAKF